MNKVKQQKNKNNQLMINRLGVILKEERITNRALAASIGYEEATVSKWATNAIQPPVSTFFRIALIINRDLKDFFVSTNQIEESDKKKYLKTLAEIAEKAKRTGKNK